VGWWKQDVGLEVLLELHGTEYTEENGYWYRIEAWQVPATPERPHGIRYNLTLHDHRNQRVLGYDNAHAIKRKGKGCYSGKILRYDHKHVSTMDTGRPYEFESAEQLLKDFLADVTKILKKVDNS